MLNLEQKAVESANKAFGLIEDMTWDMDKEFHNYHQEAFKEGYNVCQKEYEEKQKWIKVKNDYQKIDLQDDILIKFKSLNREVVVVGHIFQGRFYMNYSDNARPLTNVISWRSFL